ncbi:hypothetical protein Glove_54g51 [Diversispora epigaea]|uniref:Uncharacterized protein n=1 Tax=Diversispora epigaea TaxID=1348612 RepID=A0A397JH89_9GLOM|nr:hypothetical protein Glove_54g51 [Diversispora epigaea]
MSKNNMLELYPYLQIGQQLCHPHYCKIVEVNRGQRKLKKKLRNFSKRKILEPTEPLDNCNNNAETIFFSNVKIMTKVLYEQQRRKYANLELDPIKFKNMIENANPQLKGFFNYMVNTIVPKERSAHNQNEAKKSIVGLCYLIAGLRNKFVNQHKLEVGLYLIASGATWESIDTISSLGYSACAKTVEEYRKKIQKEHIIKIKKYFIENKNILHIYNIDDYHSIHEIRQPNTVLTSLAKHFATCVAKPINEFSSVPLVTGRMEKNRTCVFNGISIYNSLNVEASRICWYLINYYTGRFDFSYLQKHSIINQSDRIEMLTIHDYNDNIIERKEERSMKGLQLVGFEEQHLHSVFDYINALKIILSINNRTQYLRGFVAPVVADWPGQLFIRKALRIQTLNSPQEINSFLSMLGLLHVSLNSIEQQKKPRLWRINLLLELAKCGWLKIKDQVIKKFGKVCKDIEYQTVIDLLDNLIPAVIDIYATLFRSGLFEKYVETIFRIWTFALRWKRKNYNKAPLVFLSDLFYWKDNDHPFFNALQKHLSCFNDYYVENTHSKIRANTSPNATVDNIIKQAYVIMNHDSIFKDTYCKTRHYPYNISTLDFLSNKTSLFLLQYFRDLYYNLEKREEGADILTQEDFDDDENNIEEGEEQSEEVEIQEISNRLEIEIHQIENW